MKIIGITGTPGTGKKTIALELSKNLKYEYINLNEYAFKNKLINKIENDYIINDLELFAKKIKKTIKNGNFIISGHLLPDIISKEDIDMIIILRCSPVILLNRYKKRQYNDQKIKDNIISEAIGIIQYESRKKYGKNKVFEINVTDKNIKNIIKELTLIINKKQKIIQKIDWLDIMISKKILREYLK
tara:strand:- start:31 stop:591 length:561 start_codon:yes stop_codon:yes gene_type:complete